SNGARNLISANAHSGIEVSSGTATILGNYVGTTAAGDTALGNAFAGIRVDAAGTATIGSGVQGSGNVISANFDGVVLAPGTTGISVKGNLVGTNATGTAALGNVAAG